MSRPQSKVSVEIREMARALAGIRNRGKGARRGGGGIAKLLRPLFRKSA